MPRILITGATGTLGHALLPQIAGQFTTRIISRKPRPQDVDPSLEWHQGDLTQADSLSRALEEVDIVVHAATSPAENSEEVDVKGTRNLLQAAQQHDIKHFVYPSIIGIDQIPMKYYQCKVRAEQSIKESGLPYSIQRFSQYHNLIDAGLKAFNRIPGIMFLPKKFLFQPLDPKDAARYLAETIYALPDGRKTDVAGPDILPLEELAKAWFEARDEHKRTINLPIPGRVARGFRAGYNTEKHLPPPVIRGETSWREWLELRYTKYRRQKERK